VPHYGICRNLKHQNSAIGSACKCFSSGRESGLRLYESIEKELKDLTIANLKIIALLIRRTVGISNTTVDPR
jgi:hypothetical protein